MEFQSRGIKVEDEPGGKRRATAEDWTANKKRALSSTSDSPVAANGIVDDSRKNSKPKAEDDEPQDEDELEHFRKAAIFRRMRYYQRDYYRVLERCKTLERLSNESALARTETEACWQSIIDTVRRLIDVDALSSKVVGGKDGYVESSAILKPSRVFNQRDMEKSRARTSEKIEATKKVILAFVALAKDSKLEPPIKEVLIRDQRELQQSNTFLRGETERVYELYEEASQDREKYVMRLKAMESKFDRLQSRILNPIPNQSPELRAEVNGKEGKQVKVEIEKEASPSVVESLALLNGDSSSLDDLKGMVESRESRILELEKENATLRDQIVMANTEIALLGEDVLMKTPTYRILLDHASKLEHIVKEKTGDIERLNNQIKASAEQRTSWQKEIVDAAVKEADELKQVVKKRDDECNRLRIQRDKLEAELKESETVNKSKWSSIGKFKVQASERRKRVEVLQSEIRRLSARLAANENQAHLLDFLLAGKDLENYPSVIDSQRRDLEKEVEGLRSLVKASKSGLEDYGRLRVELESTRKRLEKYESTDKGVLMKQLDSKEEEIRALKLKDKESTAAMDSLYSEVEKLSLSWEELQNQLADQVITLEKWEDEKEKLLVAKAKADNKYYKVMGTIEAKEKERKAATHALDKYIKAWEAGKAVEEALQQRCQNLEDSLTKLKETLLKYEIRHEEHVKEVDTLKNTAETESKRIELLQLHSENRENELGEINITMLKLKDEVQKWKKEAERASSKAKAPPATASEREKELQLEIEKFMKVLKCSTCNAAMRNTVITKCMHSFCKGCVDARISHRQRKCPACNLTFSQSDVQTLYFQ